MKLGILKDIKKEEYRVILTPSEVENIIQDGHQVLVERSAGERAGFPDADYVEVGATLTDRYEIYRECDVVAKVKEVDPSEYPLLREGQILFTCIHPAAHPQEVDELLKKKVTAFAAEDSHRHGSPNCEAAGKAGVIMGLYSMMTINGGCGKFVSGLGTAPGIHALVLGCGIVGKAAIEVLQSLGAWVTVAATNVGHLRTIASKYDGKINTIVSNRYNIRRILPQVDMVVNCVRWDKSNDQFLIDRSMVASMPKGSVIVDISNDDNGAIESFHETTHENPRYIEEGVVHYCVSNIPGAIANSTSIAYAASVIPHFRAILNHGVAEACVRDGFLRRALTAYRGYLTHEETSALQGRPWVRPEDILGIADRQLDPAPPATVTRSDNYLPLEQVKL